MPKIILFVLADILLFSLCGCNKATPAPLYTDTPTAAILSSASPDDAMPPSTAPDTTTSATEEDD